jgi:O-antigen ligase
MAPFNFFAGISISGLYLRPLHLWAFGTALVLIALYRRELERPIDGPVLAFWAMFVFILVSTVFGTPAEYKFRGIADVLLLALNVVGFTVVRCYYGIRPEKWLRFFNVLAVSSVCMSLGLVFRALMAASSGRVTGVDSYALGLGTVAGTYTASFAAAATAAMVFSMDRRGFLLALGAFLVHGLAMLLSLARGPWLAFLVAVTVVIPIAAWRFRGRFTVFGTLIRGGSIAVALPTMAGIVLVVSPFVRRLVMQRVMELVQLDAGTGSARLIMWEAFMRDGLRSPVFGHGAAAYRDISEHLGVQGTVSENFVVEIFHAGGGVAVLLLLVALLGILLRCLLSPGASHRPAQTAACLVGAVALVIASTTNPAAWNGLFWLILGVVASRPTSEEATASAPVVVKKRVAPLATRSAAAH